MLNKLVMSSLYININFVNICLFSDFIDGWAARWSFMGSLGHQSGLAPITNSTK